MELANTPVRLADVAEPEAAALMRGHRERAQEIIDNATARGASPATALRHARTAIRAGQRARIQFQAELSAFAQTA